MARRNRIAVQLWFASLLIAQTPQRAVRSTEIRSDGRVTFRLAAPKATEVTLGGDWIEAPQSLNLTKDAQGTWTATVGPLSPDYYLYWFTVDGVHTVDPGNPSVLQRLFGAQNILHVPGAAADFAEDKAVPHGEIREVRYTSVAYGKQRWVHIYTPPGYEGGTGRYPVLYLIHGGGDDDSSWSSIGRAGLILDNLMAEGKAVPFIAVMPDLNKPREEGVRPTTGYAAGRGEFEEELFRDVIPIVEKTYRVASGAKNRAVAGPSLGGYATLNLLAHHTDQFAYFGVWSAPVDDRTVSEAQLQYAPILEHPEKVNDKLVWLCVGEKDGGAASVKALSEIFRKRSIQHELRVSSGSHRWTVWRHNLHDFAQELFKPRKTAP